MKHTQRKWLNSKYFCIGCKPDFCSGDYVNLNEIDEWPKRYHKIFIGNICPETTTMTLGIILRNKLIKRQLCMLKIRVFYGLKN